MTNYSRLPKTVVPVHYDLFINPSKCRKTFEGRVTVSLELKEATSEILMNCENLQITTCTIKYTNTDTLIQSRHVRYVESEGVVGFEFPSILAAGNAVLDILFTGDITPSMKGFYLSKYSDKNGVTHECLSTQFEPNYARLAFPCFDEPCFKATFALSIVAEPRKTVLFNTSVDTITEFGDGRLLYAFGRSPKMSTYLVAYIIGDFDVVSTRFAETNVQVSIYTPISKIEMGTTALESACLYLSFFNKFFGVDYILPKLDLVAISEMSFAAMENWGLITFKENTLLVDKKNTARNTLFYALLVIAHEISHQWFGNLVTMEWWVDLWLNEGFANWIEFKAVDECYPHFNIWKKFYLADCVEALELDALHNSHPIEVEVKKASEVDEIFDVISYCKGASIIRMMQDYIGDKDFTKGIQYYFNIHKFTNVTTENLWDALSKNSNKPIAKMMGSFTQKMGYPVISVECVNNADGVELTLSQRRFLLNDSKNNQTWFVPINVLVKTSGEERTHSFFLEEQTTTFSLPVTHDIEYILVNPGRIGFYRTFYSESLFNSLLANINSLTVHDRLGLLNDLFAFTKSGLASIAQYLEFVKLFESERDEDVWEYIAATFVDIRLLLASTEAAGENIASFDSYVIGVTKPALVSIGMEDDHSSGATLDPNIKFLRAILINILVAACDQDTCSVMKSWLVGYLNNTKSIEPEYRISMYMVAMNEKSTYDQIINYYSKCELNEEKIRILKSVSAMNDCGMVTSIMELALTEFIRRGDFHHVFITIGKNPYAFKTGWEFVQKNYKAIHERLHGCNLVSNIVKGVLSGLFGSTHHAEVKAFFDTVSKDHIEKAVNQSLEKIEIGHKWLTRNEEEITNWLLQY